MALSRHKHGHGATEKRIGRIAHSTVTIIRPHVRSIIALKLHATKYRNTVDAEKDWLVILALYKVHQLSLGDAAFRVMILRHGGVTTLERIKAALARGD